MRRGTYLTSRYITDPFSLMSRVKSVKGVPYKLNKTRMRRRNANTGFSLKGLKGSLTRVF